jgi:signal transduction histidine kinase
VIQKAVEVVASAAHQRPEIELSLGDEAMLLPTDPVRLEQVVWNLLNNAVEATREGGRIRLAARRQGDLVVIEVQDWGRGIDAADLPHIFGRSSKAAITPTGIAASDWGSRSRAASCGCSAARCRRRALAAARERRSR